MALTGFLHTLSCYPNRLLMIIFTHIGAPGKEDSPFWQLHAHYYPPLLRSATVSSLVFYAYDLSLLIT